MNRFVAALFLFSLSTFAADTLPRHNESGTVGPNGIKQTVDIKIMKGKTNKDQASIQLDLGDHKYDGKKPVLLTTERPRITILLGTTIVFEGTANAKAKIESPNYSAKLINDGKGMVFTMKKQDLSKLLPELLGKGEHVPLTITVQDNHPAAEAAKEARHGHNIFQATFELDVEETKASVTARG